MVDEIISPHRFDQISQSPCSEYSRVELDEEERLGYSLTKVIVPGLGQTHSIRNIQDFLDFADASTERAKQTKPVRFRQAASSLPAHLRSKQMILRTTSTDVELWPFDALLPVLFCHNLLRQHVPRGLEPHELPWDMAHLELCERVSMLLHVPELNLVAAGSVCGRVALLTLTELPRHLHDRLKRGFRCDWILPRRSDEKSQLRPVAALHGIAISPIHDPRAGRVALHLPGKKPGRYRLILHYVDHTILMYDIERRGDAEDDLLII
jgi:hypothetical protein